MARLEERVKPMLSASRERSQLARSRRARGNGIVTATLEANRVAALNVLWQPAVSDLTLEQMNHDERVPPIIRG